MATQSTDSRIKQQTNTGPCLTVLEITPEAAERRGTDDVAKNLKWVADGPRTAVSQGPGTEFEPELFELSSTVQDLQGQNRALRQQLESVIDQLRESAASHRTERQQLESELEELRMRVRHLPPAPATITWEGSSSALRSQISELQAESAMAREQLDELGAELAKVREQADRQAAESRIEADRLRGVLAKAQALDRSSALTQEALRQDLAGLRGALRERQLELREAHEARHVLEDELEDTHREMDRLRAELRRLRGANISVDDDAQSMGRATTTAEPETTKTVSRLRNLFLGRITG